MVHPYSISTFSPECCLTIAWWPIASMGRRTGVCAEHEQAEDVATIALVTVVEAHERGSMSFGRTLGSIWAHRRYQVMRYYLGTVLYLPRYACQHVSFDLT